MLLYQQTPVGEKIKLGKPYFDNKLLESFFRPYKIKFYDSGTSALAAAILASINKTNGTTPEVLIPAYSCPDLVSAILYAGARPILVDFEEDRPWMDLDQLQWKITSKTTAVIAVNLFGIPERLKAIKEITDKNNITLIEDSAQSFPYAENSMNYSGDIVILSFGRGKPVNMLTGGAVLFIEKKIGKLLPEVEGIEKSSLDKNIKYMIKASIYNILISPYIYGYLEKLPFLHLGETRFVKHHSIETINSAMLAHLYRNIKSLIERRNDIQRNYVDILSNIDNDRLINLPTECQGGSVQYLLRYPVLCVDIDYRDKLYLNLRKKGVGVSTMYQSVIPRVEGIKGQVSLGGVFKNAVAFADRLITLPLHTRTTDANLEHTRSILSAD